MGTGGDGKMPWTGQLYDIFQWCAAANTASLGGYADWRVPNDMELITLRVMEAPLALPDPVAFPSWPATVPVWTGTTRASNTAYAQYVLFNQGIMNNSTKATLYLCVLVRGG